ncbi:cysteine proteinase 1-like [Maniola hyperantus]|uniref:cysteine proteinase 1-like n=1 Tax=Aphantopus hyperantus TaxID=2795564 RepID=UPI002125EFDB
MKTILLVLLWVTANVLAKKSSPYNLREGPKHFEDFIDAHNKIYHSDDEKAKRYEIFLKNLEHINQLNAENNYTEFGVNKFTDLTLQEFLASVTCFKAPSEFPKRCRLITPQTINKSKDLGLPTQFDWRDKNVVSGVKNQGRCGSCWAFSTIGNVESINAIKTGQLVELSAQQLVDCVEINSGCTGGSSEMAIMYLVSNGSMSSASYSYDATQKQCRYDSAKVAVKVKDCIRLMGEGEDFIAEKLVEIGPLSIEVDAVPLMNYNGGVISGDTCRKNRRVSHQVLLVGYGVENNMPYWVMKNSWGEDFGEKGYFRMQRGMDCLGFNFFYSLISAVV